MTTTEELHSFEQMIKQLESSIAEMEQGEMPLADLVDRYSHAMMLLGACREKLAQAEEILTKKATQAAEQAG